MREELEGTAPITTPVPDPNDKDGTIAWQAKQLVKAHDGWEKAEAAAAGLAEALKLMIGRSCVCDPVYAEHSNRANEALTRYKETQQ